MRVALPVLLAASLLAGCATVAPVQDAEAAHPGEKCRQGAVVTGFDSQGAPLCDGFQVLADFACPTGTFVGGFDDGVPQCRSLYADRAWSTGKEATQEVSSNLKVIGIYGVRNDTSSDLWDLKINVELSAGARPVDLAQLVLRYSDGAATRNYAHAPQPLPAAAPASSYFATTWIRGAGSNAIMEAGDLVEIHFNLVSGTLPERTDVNLDLIPETGTPVQVDFRTPATYSTDTIITLR